MSSARVDAIETAYGNWKISPRARDVIRNLSRTRIRVSNSSKFSGSGKGQIHMIGFAEINGPNGVFYITTAGGKPDFEIANQYKDTKRSFYFYSKLILNDDRTYIIDVHTLTLEPFRPEITGLGKDSDIIYDNIEFFIKTREIYFPEKALSQPEKLVGVRFSCKRI